MVQPDLTPPQLTEDDLAFREAAEVLGVSLSTLKRRHKDGSLSEAVLRSGPGGEQWAIPMSDLGQLAERNGWVVNLDLRESGRESSLDATMPQVEVEAMVQARVEATRAKDRLSELERQLKRSEGDLEHERAEKDRLEADLTQTQAELGQVRSELAVSVALVGERGELVSRLEEVQAERVVEIGVLRERAVRAEMDARAVRESLGWWARRRLARNQAVSD